MIVPFFVVLEGFGLDALLGHLQIDWDDAVGVFIHGLHRQLQGIEGLAHIPIGHAAPMVGRFICEFNLHITVAPVLVRQGPLQNRHDILLGQRFEFKDGRAG